MEDKKGVAKSLEIFREFWHFCQLKLAILQQNL